MEVKFVNPGFDYMITNILGFQTEESTDFWSEPLFYFYPQLDKEYAFSLPVVEKHKYIEQHLRSEYTKLRETIDQKISLYSDYFEKCRKQISDALSDAFEIDCSRIFNDMTCNITMNPICPRFLDKHSFDIFYLNSEKGAIGGAIHEIIHFVWFYVWNALFGDSYEEYESPSIKWILSEMVVESIMKDERLSSINPYFPREEGGCIYPYFFDMIIDGKYALDVLDELYKTNKIHEFMKKSYSYCLQHEKEIREHIAKAEE